MDLTGSLLSEPANVGAVLGVGHLDGAVAKHAVPVVESEDGDVGLLGAGVQHEGSSPASVVGVLQDVDLEHVPVRSKKLAESLLVALKGQLSYK